MTHKWEIASALGKRFGFHSYLEIATATTGHEFAYVDREQFTTCMRAMYYCPPHFNDKYAIQYRTTGPSISPLVDPLLRGPRFDLVFVDTWHEYVNTAEDIELALSLLAPDGMLLIHDCSPVNEYEASPRIPIVGHSRPGHCCMAWSGATYAAYLDKVVDSFALDYVTFDADYGCGLVSLDRHFSGERPSDAIKKLWKERTPENQYSVFDTHRKELLRLRPVTDIETI
jgi:hypothetical protein